MIVLPAIAFLRLIRIGRLLALKQLVRTTRVFRLRGLLFRAWRAVVTLNVIDMILRRDPSERLERTKEILAEKLDEIGVLRQEIARLEQIVANAAVCDTSAAANQVTSNTSNPAAPTAQLEKSSSVENANRRGPGLR